MPHFFPANGRALEMVGLAFLSQAFGFGTILASYSVIIPEIEAGFHTSRTVSSLGVALLALAMGLLGPLIGKLMTRVSIRAILVCAALANAGGYVLLTFAATIYQFMAIFAVIICVGTCLMGVIAPSTLIARWFQEGRGRALGLVHMPIFLVVVPPIAAEVVSAHGMNSWFYCMAAMYLVLASLMLRVVDEPPAPTGLPVPAGEQVLQDAIDQTAPAMGILIRDPRFWMLTMGIALASGIGNAFLSHVVPIAESRGISLRYASLLLVTYGAAGVLGNLLFGWLADRLTASRALVISTLGQALLWIAIFFVADFWAFLAIVAILGILTTSLLALHGAAIADIFGPRMVGSVMGLGYLLKLPLIFAATPLAGFLFDRTGSYQIVFATFAGVLLGASLFFVALDFFNRTAQRSRRILTSA